MKKLAIAFGSLSLLLLNHSLAAQEKPLALLGATLHDGQGGTARKDSVVIIRDGRIQAVGSLGELTIPDDAERIDLAGRHMTPGLVDAHVHYSQTGWADGRPDASDQRITHPYPETMAANAAHPERFHRAFLAAGVTAVFDVGGYPWTRRLGDETENDPFAPHVGATGALLTTFVPAALQLPDQQQFVLMADEETARAGVRSHAAFGSDAIKVWFIVRRNLPIAQSTPLLYAVADEAAKHGLDMVVHATSLETAEIAVDAGAKLLVHSVDDRPISDEFIAALLENGTAYCPTLTVAAGYHYLHSSELSTELQVQLESVHPSVRERALLTKSLTARFSARNVKGNAMRLQMQAETMHENLLRIHEAGVPVVMGTDAGNPLTLHGPSVYPEMEAMQAAGMTAAEVLVASTKNAAKAMGRGSDLGVIAVGRIADLLILEDDPSADITNMRSLLLICRAGILHKREDLLNW